jgi:hypothetical protein
MRTNKVLKEFEAVVGIGTVEALYVHTASHETDLQGFRRKFAAAVDKYHMTRLNQSVAALMLANNWQAKLLGRVREFMGADNYRAMLEEFDGSRQEKG